jgi:hypothetical protein
MRLQTAEDFVNWLRCNGYVKIANKLQKDLDANADMVIDNKEPVLHCLLNEDTEVQLPQVCVFDDPDGVVNDCAFARNLCAQGRLKTACEYYKKEI